MRILLVLAALASCEPTATQLSPADVRVIDGDTIDWGGQRWRLTGYDTPETFRASCPSEKALGDQATGRLRDLLRSADRIELIAEDGRDKFGRGLAELQVDGRDVGRILIEERLARPFLSGRRQSWC